MHAALDVHYSDEGAHAACVGFAKWTDEEPVLTKLVTLPGPVAYEPGQFYRRELDPLLAILKATGEQFQAIVIDAYCHLDAGGTPGLGTHLYNALEKTVAIIGVAKNRFRDTAHAIELLGGESQRPLFITGIAIPTSLAAEHIQGMHGAHRHPTLLKLADQLFRAHLS
jgi:deoxyribonuclease V